MDFPADRFEKIVVDLMDEDDSQKVVAAAISRHGAIDAAILTVGGFAMGHIADTKTADILKQFKLNFETAYNIARPRFFANDQTERWQDIFDRLATRIKCKGQ
jgi:NAD(P)-dependent dehydrogenase (short-subunit alcohol dehydrogenase family)